MPRELHSIHSKNDCKNNNWLTFWIEFPGGCRLHFRGESFAKNESCKHKLVSPSNLEAAFLALSLIRQDISGKTKVVDNAGATIAFVYLRKYEANLEKCTVAIHPQCKCIQRYDNEPALEILEKHGENDATIKTLFRILEGELPTRPLKIRT